MIFLSQFIRKIISKALLSISVILSLLFAFNVRTNIIHAATVDDDVTVEDDPAPEDEDEDVTTNNDDENTNDDDEEETATQAEDGEEAAEGVKITNTADDTESNTVKYVANVDSSQMAKNAAAQAKVIAKEPDTIKKKPMTDYTMSDSNHYWVPYWYYYLIINNQSTSSMPKKHPTNVKTSKQNVKRYQNYVNKKAKSKATNEGILTVFEILIIVAVMGIFVKKCFW